MRRLGVAVLGVASATLLATSSVAAGGSSDWVRIASGLHSPRGVDVAPNGEVYVAIAGVGDGSPNGNPGPTGEVIRIQYPRSDSPRVKTVATGLPSVGSEGESVGP